MTIRLGLLAIAVGAILKFALTTRVAGISIPTVGVILMAVGAVAFVVGLGVVVANGGSVGRSM